MEELPRLLNKREAKKTPAIEKWIMQNISSSCMVEVKQTRTATLPANSIKPHQRETLLAVKYIKKLSDALGQRQPADIIYFYKPINYYIIVYGNNEHILIEARKLLRTDQKLTQEEARKIGKVIKV